ncbi:MAG: hypothetical protein RIC85_03070 [Gammaproteobacteria bacterium]
MTTRLRTNVYTRTTTRIAGIQDTGERFLNIARAHNANMTQWDLNFEIMVRNRAITKIEIVVHDADDTTVGWVWWTIDWDEHQNQIISFGEDIDLTGLEEGETFPSVEECLQATRTYFDALVAKADRPFITTWFTLNPAEVEKYGEERIFTIIGYAPSDEEQRWNERMNGKIALIQRSGRSRDTRFADLPEARVGAGARGTAS